MGTPPGHSRNALTAEAAMKRLEFQRDNRFSG
jgi:hypothetical protein